MVFDAKNIIRRRMLVLRDDLTELERKEKSHAIAAKLFTLEEYKSAIIVAFYLTIGSEVDTTGMISQSLTLGKKVLIPVTKEEIEFVEFTSFEDLAPAKYGILEPKTKLPAKQHPDLIITPGLAFDLDFHRLGYGKGYYDRLFRTVNSKRIGICFDSQLVEKIPKREHDQKLDIVITDKRIIKR